MEEIFIQALFLVHLRSHDKCKLRSREVIRSTEIILENNFHRIK